MVREHKLSISFRRMVTGRALCVVVGSEGTREYAPMVKFSRNQIASVTSVGNCPSACIQDLASLVPRRHVPKVKSATVWPPVMFEKCVMRKPRGRALTGSDPRCPSASLSLISANVSRVLPAVLHQ